MRSSRSVPALNPKLQQALSCLDLRLEDELTRYRRQRAGLSVAPLVLRPKQPKKSLDLMSFGETEATTAAPVTSEAPPKAISFDLGVSAIAEKPIEDSAMIPYAPETAGEALYEFANGSQTPPDDYLESSEHLLKSLEREEAKVEVERGFLESLSTPFGIGSMLTLLLSSAMLGYVIMNPSILSGIGQRMAQPETSETTIAQGNGSIPNSPPLDRDEFSELGLDTLSVIRTKPQPIPSIATSPIASPSPTASPSPATAAVIAAPSTALSAPPIPVTASVSPAPAASSVLLPSITVPQPPKTPQSLQYKVEIPFTGDQSLAEARQVVPDAFVRSDGKIQLAATSTQSEAQKKAQDLKGRGLAAEVRQP